MRSTGNRCFCTVQLHRSDCLVQLSSTSVHPNHSRLYGTTTSRFQVARPGQPRSMSIQSIGSRSLGSTSKVPDGHFLPSHYTPLLPGATVSSALPQHLKVSSLDPTSSHWLCTTTAVSQGAQPMRRLHTSSRPSSNLEPLPTVVPPSDILVLLSSMSFHPKGNHSSTPLQGFQEHVVVSHRHPSVLHHLSASKWPRAAAPAHVHGSQEHSFDPHHLSTTSSLSSLAARQYVP